MAPFCFKFFSSFFIDEVGIIDYSVGFLQGSVIIFNCIAPVKYSFSFCSIEKVSNFGKGTNDFFVLIVLDIWVSVFV